MVLKSIVAQRTLYDVRDSNSYTVAKLADGNCWMTSNLKYTLTANTDAIGVDHATNNTFTFNTGAACTQYQYCIMNGNTAMTEQVTGGGYYYNWQAATADTGTASMASGDATGPICPKGWRLPANYTSDQTKSYSSITRAYLGFAGNTSGNYTAKMEAIPLQFSRAGYYSDGVFHNGAPDGFYWSSTVGETAGKAHQLRYFAESVSPQRTVTDALGFSVRCVAQ